MNSEAKAEDKNYQHKLLLSGTYKRKIFGLLERPNFPPTVTQAAYKLFVCGRPGSGKTWARSRLVGHEVCSEVGREEAVAGIEASVVYWPMKVGGKLQLFRLELWEAGEWSVRRYDHILPACREGVSGVLLCFSLTDQAGWQELPRLLASSAQPLERATLIPLATKIGDSASNWEVTPSEIQSLEERCSVSVLRMPAPTSCSHSTGTAAPYASDTLPSSAAGAAGGGLHGGGTGTVGSSASTIGNSEEMQAIAPILNAICTKLWQRDQELLASK